MTDNTHDPIYLWLDLETTGLDPVEDRILEVGWFITDSLFELISRQHSRLAEPTMFINARLEDLSQFVREMHEKSGLLDDLARAARQDIPSLPLFHIEHMILRDLTGQPDEIDREVILAGHSPQGVDRPFIDLYMKNLARRLSHRQFDVRTVEDFARAVGFKATIDTENPTHRAIDDANMSWQVTRDLIAQAQRGYPQVPTPTEGFDF